MLTSSKGTRRLLRKYITDRYSLPVRNDPSSIYTNNLHVIQISLRCNSLHNGSFGPHRVAVIVVENIHSQSLILRDEEHAEVLTELDVKVQKQVVRERVGFIAENAEKSVFVPIQNTERTNCGRTKFRPVRVLEMMNQLLIYSQWNNDAVVVLLKQRNHMLHKQRERFLKHSARIYENPSFAADKLFKVGFGSDIIFLFFIKICIHVCSPFLRKRDKIFLKNAG